MIVRFSVILVLILTIPLIVRGQAAGSKKELGKIKAIYVDDDPYGTPDDKAIKPLLKFELKKQGFIVSETKDAADAVLSGVATVEVTLDATYDSPPDKAIYPFKLLSRNNKVLWKHTVKFVSKRSWLENNKVGAQKLVEKLTQDVSRARQLTKTD